ncbi:hypothetical protein M0R45_005047 [Rubus argutus]|uniref:Uncharacterized protein n=1 Tax=Rubus argutus TaxID=59490 RepID=A0AAW1YLL2_RUBAR
MKKMKERSSRDQKMKTERRRREDLPAAQFSPPPLPPLCTIQAARNALNLDSRPARCRATSIREPSAVPQPPRARALLP